MASMSFFFLNLRISPEEIRRVIFQEISGRTSWRYFWRSPQSDFQDNFQKFLEEFYDKYLEEDLENQKKIVEKASQKFTKLFVQELQNEGCSGKILGGTSGGRIYSKKF